MANRAENNVIVYQWPYTEEFLRKELRCNQYREPPVAILSVGQFITIQPDLNIIILTKKGGEAEQFPADQVWARGAPRFIKFPVEIEEKRQLRWDLWSIVRDYFHGGASPVYSKHNATRGDFPHLLVSAEHVRTIEFVGGVVIVNPFVPWGKTFVYPREKVELWMQDNKPSRPIFDLTPVSQ